MMVEIGKKLQVAMFSAFLVVFSISDYKIQFSVSITRPYKVKQFLINHQDVFLYEMKTFANSTMFEHILESRAIGGKQMFQ